MHCGSPSTTPARFPAGEEDNARREARLFIDSLAERLSELRRLANLAGKFDIFSQEEYVEFRRLFEEFRSLCEEFQLLSHVTEKALNKWGWNTDVQRQERELLEEYFRRLQIPMLQSVITTNLRLLRIWDDRLQRGEGLPYGARELFLDTIRVIHKARTELLRPRYIILLDEAALHDAERATRLLKELVDKAPALFDFLSDDGAATTGTNTLV